jgi:hypothetical protein
MAQGEESAPQILPKQALFGCSRLEILKLRNIRCPDGLVCFSLKRIVIVEHVQRYSQTLSNSTNSADATTSPRAVAGLRQTLTAFMQSSQTKLTSIRLYLIEDCVNSSAGMLALAHLSSQLSLPCGWRMKVGFLVNLSASHSVPHGGPVICQNCKPWIGCFVCVGLCLDEVMGLHGF